MTWIHIDIHQDENRIEITNNGKGIAVEWFEAYQMYIPTFLFGLLSTSTKFDDGKNGMGAKLCNIFSKKFSVETSSKESKKKFEQTWIENMSKKSEPKIDNATDEDYTKITFNPDLSKFQMEKLDDDIVALMICRAFDVAASTHTINVFVNGQKVEGNLLKRRHS